ncbi:hypothetical protein [Polycladidibacter stylochi]|uniref:hypothetical protein n=1 Tax=Polycladidibacter stylochi TaxID=1807766 RepID=UPI00082F8E36|nr:hypothetical protein [Pseudovibrio stylochi]
MKELHAHISLADLGHERLACANINPTTGLATDYLNHFNEVIMLLEMLPAMPDCVEDVLDWKPKSYIEHFEDSSFSERELAIEAYYAAPSHTRDALEMAIQAVDKEVGDIQSVLCTMEVTNPDYLRELQYKVSEVIQPLVCSCIGIIHGRESNAAPVEQDTIQADVDALFS